MNVAINARVRHQGIMPAQALDPRRGYMLGRLLLEGRIGRAEHDVGLRYGEDMARYYGLNGYTQPSVRAQNLFAVRGESAESDGRAEAAKIATKQARRIQAALVVADKITGFRVGNTVKHVCLLDEPVSNAACVWLQYGLSRLAREVYGME